ncbi:MAG TPA: lamin tail domain-containing protein, partial [Solirubrobacteraceae bacterium]
MSPRTRSPLTLLALAAAALCATAALPAAASAENFGDVVINEFRTHGPGGAADEFIELKNTTNAPINLRPSGSNRMWVVEYWVPSLSDWRYFFFDANRTIPARGRLLLVNKTTAGGGYSLDAYRAGDLVYNPAATGQPDIPTTSGVRLWSDVIYDANMSLTWDASSLNVDEVGAPPHGTDQATQYSYVRK